MSRIAVFGEECYVVVNRMTGKITAYRKMPVSDVDGKPIVKVTKSQVLKIAKARGAKLYVVPGVGTVWFTDGDAVDVLLEKSRAVK